MTKWSKGKWGVELIAIPVEVKNYKEQLASLAEILYLYFCHPDRQQINPHHRPGLKNQEVMT